MSSRDVAGLQELLRHPWTLPAAAKEVMDSVPFLCTTLDGEQGSHIMQSEVMFGEWKEAPGSEAGLPTNRLHECHSSLVQDGIGRISERAYTRIAK